MTYAIDPELAVLLPMFEGGPIEDPAASRAAQRRMLDSMPTPDLTGVAVHDHRAPGPEGGPDVTLRLYSPLPAAPGRLSPAVYHLHGGGFMVGSIDIAHSGSVELCRATGAVVAVVGYRLAPEDPFPAGVEDSYAGLVWLAANAPKLGIDASRIVVHGLSAGGGLAAATALLSRDRSGPAIAFQYLGTPVLDDRMDTPSMRAYTDTPAWSRPCAEVSWNAYLGPGKPGSEGVSPYAAPARHPDVSGLPPAYVSVMQFDPLRDEGIAYAQRLLVAGVPVELHVFPGAFHGSRMVSKAEVSERESAEEVRVLRRALYGPKPAAALPDPSADEPGRARTGTMMDASPSLREELPS